MKKITLLFTLFICYHINSQTPECYPNKDGTYQYYVELDLKKIPDDFGIKDFSKLLELDVKKFSITSVEKSFPTAQTARLQKVVSVFSKEQNIHEKLKEYPKVLLAEQLCHPKEMMLYEPNDYGIQADPFLDMSHLELINAKEAWDITTGDERIRIGILDTALDPSHEELSNKNIIIDANNCAINNNWHCAHGTEVTGAAAGDSDNNLGIPSIGFNSSIRFSSLISENRVLQMSQTGTVKVINMSWVNNCNFNIFSQMVYDEILNIHNVVLTAGAGNGPNFCNGGKCYPASYDEVISVTSVGHNHDRNTVPAAQGRTAWKDLHEHADIDANGVLRYRSHQHNEKVNIAAPGYNVPLPFPTNTIGTGYGVNSGTSFAAPMVAGVCALVAAVNPCLTAPEIMDIVLSTADAGIYNLAGNHSFIGQLGTGRVDAHAAVLEAVRRGRLNIQNTTLSGTNTYNSETSIYAGYNVTSSQAFGNVLVASNSDIRFEATHEIILQHGFEVSDNTSFEAKIIDSNCY